MYVETLTPIMFICHIEDIQKVLNYEADIFLFYYTSNLCRVLQSAYFNTFLEIINKEHGEY